MEGYASLFGEIDQARDMVMRGAFADTLAARGIRRIPMLFQHDPAEPVGVWLELREDHRGLFARGRLIPDVTRARELLSLVRAGAIDGLSIGFRTVKGRIDPRTRIRRLHAVDLWEISIVTFPLLAGARVRAVKQAPSRPALSHARTRAEREWAKSDGAPCAAEFRRGCARARRFASIAGARIWWRARAGGVSVMLTADPDIRRLMALRAFEAGLLRLKWLAAATRFEIALARHDRALKAGFNPNEPRVPRGNPDGGQWTDGGGGSSGKIRPAGDIPAGDSPEIPKERPPTSRARSAALKAAARLLGPMAATVEIAKLGMWFTTYSAEIRSYGDPPKSLDDLQQAVSTPAPGYEIHHIVEQSQAERDGFTRDVIDSPDNLVRIPTMKRQEINGWYQKPNLNFGGKTPRDYLSGRNWAVRRSVGLEALTAAGVLKP